MSRSPSASSASSASLLVRRIEPKRAVGKTAAPGLVDLHAEHAMANADLQVGRHQDRTLVAIGHELDVLEDRLRTARRDDSADHPERGEQSFAVAQGLHAVSPNENDS